MDFSNSPCEKKGYLSIHIDYREVNERIQADHYPLPHTDALLSKSANARCFSTLYLSKGFCNLRLEPESQQYTGFVVPGRGVFTWTVCPFGIKPAPDAFQRRLEELFQEEISKGHVLIYLDGIIIFTENAAEHIDILLTVLQKLVEVNMCISVKKSRFLDSRIRFLGHQIEGGRVIIDEDRIAAISSLKTPSNRPELLSFLGGVQFLSPFIPDLASLADAFRDLRNLNAKWKWNECHQVAYQEILDSITRENVYAGSRRVDSLGSYSRTLPT